MDREMTISVKELLDELALLKNDDKVFFGNGNLSFYRVKERGENLFQIEFNETYTVEK